MVTAVAKPPHSDLPVEAAIWAEPIVVDFPEGVLTDDLLLAIAGANYFWRFARNAEGGLEIVPPPGTRSGSRGGTIANQIMNWADGHGGGLGFAAGSGFHLPSGAVKDPDCAWLSPSRLAQIDATNERIWRVCPDLIVEVRSPGQRVSKQKEKMDEWMVAGARLGWLIDPFTGEGEVWVYREGADEPEFLERPESMSGEDVADGLIVELSRVWR